MNCKALLLLFLVLLAACTDLTSLRSDQPIQPVREYERMIVGRLDADYVGDAQCLAKCHKHDQLLKDFDMSVHGEQVEAESGLPLVNCESCHGPGSLAVKHLTEKEQITEKDRCDFDTFLQLEELPAQAQSLVCLKCHSAASTPSLQFWNAGFHASNDVSCFDCHTLHQGPQQKPSRHEMDEVCYNCHQKIRMEFGQFSHHPVPEHKMVCVDCHDPHGTAQEHNLKGTTVRETCTRCHAEFQGPFVYEHADVTEDCANCHSPHGSPNNPLLTVAQPFLCMQCHAGHQDSHHQSLTDDNFKGAFYTRCTDCHSAIHGTDVPSSKGKGSFIGR